MHKGMSITEITDIAAPQLDIYARLGESQLYHINEPAPGLFIAESPKVIERALDAGYESVSLLLERQHIEGEARAIVSRCAGVPVYTAETPVLERLTGFKLTRGALCAMRRRPLPALEEVCAGARRIAVLENVMNPTNVGAIFRSAAALGFDAVVLTPGCSDPLYRRAARVSMGTVFQIPWTCIENTPGAWPEKGLQRLSAMGFATAAMALDDTAIGVDDPRLMAHERLAVVLGAEGDGLAERTVAGCDYTVCIPMAHGVDSLNVAAASAVAFWQLRAREE